MGLPCLPDWIDGQVQALIFFGGVTRAIVCDNLKAGVAKALWFEPTLNATFAAMAEHYDTTVLPTRSRKPRDKGKVVGAVLIVERWILARLRNRTFFSLAQLNTAIRLSKAGQSDIRRLLIIGAMMRVMGRARHNVPAESWIGRKLASKPKKKCGHETRWHEQSAI